MIIEDYNFAASVLKHINYYRLSGYWKIFEELNDSDHHFRQNTQIELVVNLYNFDKKLRLIILEAIELFEVSFRTVWSYTLSNTCHDSHAYLNHSIFDKKDKHIKDLSDIMKNYSNSKEDYLVHYMKNYDSPILPPIWSICESFSFGTLFSLYSNLSLPLKKHISREYSLDEDVFESCLRNINTVRNICAHHSRLWNRQLTSCRIKTPKKPESLHLIFEKDNIDGSKIFNTILILSYFTRVINPSLKWLDDLELFLINSLEKKIINASNLKMMGIKSILEFEKIRNL